MSSRTTTRAVLRLVVATLLAGLAMAGWSVGPASAIEPPTVDEVTLTPSSLPGNGGTVTVRAHLYSEADVLGASTTFYLADGTTAGAEMQRESFSSEYWTAEVTVPANLTSTFVTHDVEIRVWGLDGQQTQQRVGTLEQAAQDTVPVLSGAVVSPKTLPAGGGLVTLRVTASDDRAITRVYAEVKAPDGKVTTVELPSTGTADTYQGTLTVPANPGLTVLKHTVRFRAVDDDAQGSSVAGSTISVASRAVTSTPSVVDFGHVVVGSTKALSTKLTNNTTAPVTVTLAIADTQPYTFTATKTRSYAVTIAAGATKSVGVLFAPTARGTKAMRVTGTLSIPGQLALSLPVIGTGVSAW